MGIVIQRFTPFFFVTKPIYRYKNTKDSAINLS